MNRRLVSLFLVVAAAGIALAPSSTQAQFISFAASESDITLQTLTTSTRLTSMGGLTLTIPDENRELNLSDFGMNVAGLATDKDGWDVEARLGKLAQSNDWNSTRGGLGIRQREVVVHTGGQTQVFYRRLGHHAVGLVAQWDSHDRNLRFGADDLTRGTRVTGYLNRRIVGIMWGASVTTWGDNEDMESPDLFALRHYSDLWAVRCGAARDLLGLRVAGELDFERVSITGKSRDAAGFHQDDFEWRRPATGGRLTVLLPAGRPLEAGFNATFQKRDGTEQATISWADRFPSNPGRFPFSVEVPTFHEKERESAVEARASYTLTPRFDLGLYAGWGKFTSDVTQSPNWIGSRSAQNLEETRTRLGGGLGAELRDQALRVGVEAFAVLRDRHLELPRSIEDRVARDLELHLGAEWLVRPDLALRGGLERISVDEDVDQPETLDLGFGYAVGIGYLPRGGTVSLDFGLRGRQRRPDGDTADDRKMDLTESSVAVRFVF